jgi:hypothetical protein
MTRMQRIYIRLALFAGIAALALVGLVNADWSRSLLGLPQQPVYEARARIAVGFFDHGDKASHFDKAYTQSRLESQIEIVHSRTLHQRTLERLRSIHPEFKEVPVSLTVLAKANTSILELSATGAEPKWTRGYLDSLLDEWRDMARSTADKETMEEMNYIIECVLRQETSLKEAAKRLSEAENSHGSQALIERRKRELEDAKKAYEFSKINIERVDRSSTSPTWGEILERPIAAVLKEEGFDPIAIAARHLWLALGCLIFALPLALYFPLPKAEKLSK